MKIMNRMLCYKILLPSTGTLQLVKLHNSIFYFIKSRMLHSSVIQLRCQKIESADVKLENLAEDKNDKLVSIIHEYIQNINPKFRNKILQNYFSFNMSSMDLYLISRKESEKFVALIKDDLFENMCHVIESNPGFGILTETLLEVGVPFLTLYEKNKDFYSDLHNLYMKYPRRFILRKANIFRMSKTLNSHSSDVSMYELLKDVTKRKWEKNTCMQIIGTVTNSTFLRHLIMSVLFQSGFMSYGRPSFYFAISPRLWNNLTQSDRKLSTIYIMFNILFNYKIFGTLDRNAFIPWQRKVSIRKNIKQSNDYHVLYVIKLEPKPNLFTMFDKEKDLIHFWHFVRHHFYKPSQRIIPALEKQVSGCGIRLIEKNYNIFTQFSELSVPQVYDLFIELQSWPEYNASALMLGADEMRKIYYSHIKEEDN